jgi:hypothetical protein
MTELDALVGLTRVLVAASLVGVCLAAAVLTLGAGLRAWWGD